MSGISAETYARRCAERELRVPDGEWGPPQSFPEAVRALISVGLLDAELASRVVADYGRARTLRGLQGYVSDSDGRDRSTRVDGIGQPIRVARCSSEFLIEDATVVLTSVTLQPHRTRFTAAIRREPDTVARRLIPRPPPFPAHDFTVTDDTGRTVSVGHAWGGAGGRTAWYNAWEGLSLDTVWLVVNGIRVVLDDTGVGAAATAETFVAEQSSTAERAARYLQHYALGTVAHEPLPPLAVVVEALVACGALSTDSPDLRSALQSDERVRRLTRSAAVSFPSRGQPGSSSEPSSQTVVVGVTTPPIDGVRITVVELTVSDGHFRMEVDGSGVADLGENHRPRFNRPRLAIWAADDVGNRCRGSIGEFNFGSAGFSGTVTFHPHLDSNASVLNLEFDTDRAQAIVQIPLPLNDRP
jgi:hypothetical protein